MTRISRELGVDQTITDYLLHYNHRYDYEDCDSEPSDKMMKALESKIVDSAFAGTKFVKNGTEYVVAHSDNFEYVDPIDQSVSKNQVRYLTAEKSEYLSFFRTENVLTC